MLSSLVGVGRVVFFVGYKVVCGFGLDYELESFNIFSLVSMVLYRLVVLCSNKAADGFNYVTTWLLLVFFVLRAFFFVLCFLVVAPTLQAFYPVFLLFVVVFCLSYAGEV